MQQAGLMQQPQGAPAAAEAPVEGGQAATPEEQQDYDRAVAALMKILYKDDKTHAAIMQKIDPNNPGKSITELTVLLITELDQRLDIMETVIINLIPEVVDRLVELAEKSGRIQIEDREVMRIAGAASEMILQQYGTTPEDAAAVAGSVSDAERAEAEQMYKGLLNGQGG